MKTRENSDVPLTSNDQVEENEKHHFQLKTHRHEQLHSIVMNVEKNLSDTIEVLTELGHRDNCNVKQQEKYPFEQNSIRLE